MRVGFRSLNATVNSVMPRKFQEGGAMPAGGEEMPAEVPVEEGGAPAEGGEAPADPAQMLMQLAQMAMQALQGQDAQAAFAVCEGVVQLVQQIQGGGQGAPAQEAPAEPVYRRGGRLVRRIRK